MSFDIKEIQKQVEEVLCYAREEFNDCDIHTDSLMEKWLEAKKDYIKAFGGELVYQSKNEITISLTPLEKLDKADEFINWVKQHSHLYAPPCFVDFLEDNKEGFFDNKVVRDCGYEQRYHLFLEGDKIQEITLRKGDKLIKSFKHFFKDAGYKGFLRTVQDKASEIIQQDKITGYLCLSVHPLDFLSASENAANWDSCHRLNGEYAAGNLSYLLDECTVMAYLKSTEGNDVEISNFPFKWNSKKWRMWLYFDKNWKFIMAGREYPYSCSRLMTITLGMVEEFTQRTWLGWSDTYTSHDSTGHTLKDKYLTINDKFVSFDKIIKEGTSYEIFYNDLTLSSYYTFPYYSYTSDFYKRNTVGDIIEIVIGADVPCLSCIHNVLDSSECFVCEDCFERSHTKGTCEWCGSTIYDDDNLYETADGETICESCFENKTITCDRCGEIYEESYVYYDDDTERYLCESCRKYEEEEKKE